MRVVVISGVSGSGKSIALNVLEDAGYFCIDNLPSWLLPQLIGRFEQEGRDKVAVAIDVRGGDSIKQLPYVLRTLNDQGVDLRFLFLDARKDTLMQRFSETRRRHPLVADGRTLEEAIAMERQLLDKIAVLGHTLDTSGLKPAGLREWVRQFAGLAGGHGLTLVFQSFGFKAGVPQDADLVFDVRCLPNPHYEPTLRPLTGQDAPVADYLAAQADVPAMITDIKRFIERWLPGYLHDQRNYLTVAIGCTGGQHRSVYVVERLAAEAFSVAHVIARHRELQRAGGRA